MKNCKDVSCKCLSDSSKVSKAGGASSFKINYKEFACSYSNLLACLQAWIFFVTPRQIVR